VSQRWTEGVRGHIPMVFWPGIHRGHRGTCKGLTSVELRFKATGAGFEQLARADTVGMDVPAPSTGPRSNAAPSFSTAADFTLWQSEPQGYGGARTFSLARWRGPRATIWTSYRHDRPSAAARWILAGGGAVHRARQLIRLADRLEAPLATHIERAKGCSTPPP